MAEYNPDDLIGRTFLLPLNQNGERHRTSIEQKMTCFYQKLRLSPCGTKPQHSRNHQY